MNTKDFVETYVKSHSFKAMTTSSKRIYGYALRYIILEFGETHIEDIKRPDILALREKMSSRPGMANVTLRVLSLLLNHAVDTGLIPLNPAARVKSLNTKNHKAWTVDDVSKMMGLNDRVCSTATVLAWYTGQRESDILNMKWSDIQGGHIKVVQQKTGIEMKIKLHSDLVNYLNALGMIYDGDAYIVSGKDKMRGQTFRNKFKRALDLTKIDKVFHGIRKGVASNLAENGVSVSEISAILGHKTFAMAQLYTQDASRDKLTANAVNGLTSCLSPAP